jgi:hypothetical protein
MSGQRSYGEGGGGPAASSAAGCELRESSQGRQQGLSDRSLLGGGSSAHGDVARGAGNGSFEQGSPVYPRDQSGTSLAAGESSSTETHPFMYSSQEQHLQRTSCLYSELACFLWGRGEDGQLGIGDTSDQESATYVDALRSVGVHQIACGSGHTVVLTREGEVYTW